MRSVPLPRVPKQPPRVKRGLLVVFALVVSLIAAVPGGSVSAQQTDDGDGIWLVTIPGNDAGWAILNGTGQWVSPTCRTTIENFGGSFEIVEWPVIGNSASPARELDCTEIQNLYFAEPPGEVAEPDTQPAEVSISSPTNGSTTDSLVVTGTATDNVGVDRVIVRIYNADRSVDFGQFAELTNRGGTSTGFSQSIDVPDGDYQLLVRAEDTERNRDPWTRLAITIDTDDGDGIWLVTIPGNDAGWAILNGTGQWVSPACRTTIENFGGSFEIVEWPVIGNSASPARELDCTEIQNLYFAEPPGEVAEPDTPPDTDTDTDDGDGTGTPQENLDLILSNPIRNTSFDNLDYAGVPMRAPNAFARARTWRLNLPFTSTCLLAAPRGGMCPISLGRRRACRWP